MLCARWVRLPAAEARFVRQRPLGGDVSQLSRGASTRIMYIELKTGHGGSGPAWIGRVSFSKTGLSVYYRGKTLRSLKGRAFSANYYDVKTGEEYWVSGVKRDGSDRHWAGSGPVHIDDDVRAEYLARRSSGEL